MSDQLKSQLQEAMGDARRQRDRLRASVLSTALADVRNQEIEAGREADDERVRETLARAIKQREDAASQMRSGGREELAAQEEREVEILREFLPPPLEPDEVRTLVQEIMAEGVHEMGPVMGRLMPLIKGRFDGGQANRIVREELEG